jgi:hypothetical protein
VSERMSDAELQVAIQAQEPWRQPASDQEPALAAIIDEALRARASEAALLAERGGQTGTPTHEGRYWCEIARPDGHKWGPIAPHFRNGRWQTSYTVTRYWRIPGETYTPTETPHDT